MSKNNGKNNIDVPKDVLRMSKITLKKFKKKKAEEGEDFSKKELKKAYMDELIDYLPETIDFLLRYGGIQTNEMKDLRNSIYGKIADHKFIKYLTKQIKDDEDVGDIRLLPAIIRDIISEVKMQEEKDKQQNPNANISYDTSDILNLSQLILRKKIKKADKDLGIDPDVALDLLMVIPHKSMLKDRQINYRLRLFMNVLYEHAKTVDISYESCLKLVGLDEYAQSVVVFNLLERRSKFNNFNENQQKLFIAINEWMLNQLEEMNRTDLESVLKLYTDLRKRDASQNRDEDRRYFLKSVPEDEFPNLKKVINHMIDSNGDIEKFF